MSGYSSDLNIRLGQMPEIKDNPAVFNELQNVYNAIHLLNASLNAVRRNFADVARDTPGWESFNFQGRSFWAPAANNLKAGDLVTMEGSQFVKGVKGSRALVSEGKVVCSNAPFRSAKKTNIVLVSAYDFGFCLEETEDGLAHIGWPAGIVEVAGIPVGGLAYGRQGDGKVYSNRPDNTYFPVGRIIAPEALLLQPHMSVQQKETESVSYTDNCSDS